jgi:hypothetical protein
MVYKISDLARNDMADALVDRFDLGAAAATIEIRTGAAPALTTDADSGTLLGTLTCSDPAFGNAAAGVATASAITGDTSADATGTAGHFRVKDSNGLVHLQGDITVTAGGGALELDSVAIVAGGQINITAFTITEPAA